VAKGKSNTNLNLIRYTIKLRWFFWASGFLFGLFLLALWLVPLPARLQPDYSVSMYSHHGVLLRPYLAEGDMWRFPVVLTSLPSFVIPALLAREDKRFYQHIGVDPIAIIRAMGQNMASGHVVSGGSTITMQLARLLSPRPRTLVAKIIEAFRAIQLECFLTKNDILRLYLSYAPYGGNIEGISAASYVYFNHDVADISLGEMAILLLLPQSPSRWHRYHAQDWRDARAQLLIGLYNAGVITEQQQRSANAAPIPRVRHAMPKISPHMMDYIKTQSNDQNIRTSIAIATQRLVDRIVARIQPSYQARGVHNVSLLVVENDTRAIRAAVGNFNYLQQQYGQSFATFTIPRSPGSTLKPFLYAMAIEQGKILPQTLLMDVPTHFSDYSPRNFTGQFSGLVTAENALSQSLNIPFVRLLQQVGLDYFIQNLELGGGWLIPHKQRLGLSMIIGGIELTPLQMIQLYVNLAHGGTTAPLQLFNHAHAQHNQETPWLSAGAVSLLDQALSKRDRPDFPIRKDFSRIPSSIRWKTGTSQGWRDAWSIGYNNRYTVLVWFGNVDQAPSPFLTGSTAAAPVMFEVLEALAQQKIQPTRTQTTLPSLEPIQVCAFSGDPPSTSCAKTRTVLGVKDHPLQGSCRFHQQVLIDRVSHLRVMKGCDTAGQSVMTKVLNLPPLVRHWYGEQQGGILMMPPFSPACTMQSIQKGSLYIRYPQDGAVFMLLPSFGRDDVIVPLNIESSTGLDQSVCFLNGQQFTTLPPWILTLAAGSYTLFCSNAQGGSDEVSFRVEAVYR